MATPDGEQPAVPGSDENIPAKRGRGPRPLRVFGVVVRYLASRSAVLVAAVALVAAGFMFAGVETLSWMETASFCGRCHTMGPEVLAHERSSHEPVECAECHVGSGFTGLVKAKLGGVRQMAKLVAGDYARPIPPAAHGMPPASETCGRCHDPARQNGDLLVTRSHYADDERNTEQQVALVIRLGGSQSQKTQGIHWHVLLKVEYVARPRSGDAAGTIDWIGVEKPDGTREEFIARGSLEISGQAADRAAELRLSGAVVRMSCYDCHNRVGHEFPTPVRAIDSALADQRIDQAIPFIKKRGLEAVNARYDSLAEADRALFDLERSYHREYPYLFLERPASVRKSFETLARIYREASSPEMNAAADDYPSFLGHTDSAGCFRCHDGGHYKIVAGKLSDEPIPATCSLCHTFPSVGQSAPTVPLGTPPLSHTSKLWVFEHRTATATADPSRSSCGACHSQTYCSNCHSSGAKGVKHDEMLFDHAAAIRRNGEQTCNYCHQKPYCLRCHPDDGTKK